MIEKELKELIKYNSDIHWFGIHHFKLGENQTKSELFGETFEPNSVWSKNASDIYQKLPLTLFKLVLFHKSFAENERTVIVKKKFGKKLLLRLSDIKDKIEITFQFLGNQKSLDGKWDEISKKETFNNDTLKQLIESFICKSVSFNFESEKSVLENIENFIKSNNCKIRFINKSNISLNLKDNELLYLFIGTLLWRWEILVYDRIKESNNIVRVGFVQSIKSNIDGYLACPEYLRIYYEGLRYIWKEEKELKEKALLKTAIISILIDSYAHNISAHSLAALKWWIELRYKMLDKRFKVPEKGQLLNCIQPCFTNITQDFTSKKTEKYYETLGQTDSTYNKEYFSLFDFIQFAETETVKQLFQFSSEVSQKDGDPFYPRFPVPIDYALFPFFRFLRDKGAFWSGVTRDMAFGGESKTWYKILWEDFANNPLYLGTIAKSEGINRININLEVKQNGNLLHRGRFVTIDMSVIDYEEKLSQDPKLDSEKYKELLNNSVKDNNECESCKDYVEFDKYSKYAFVKIGKCFKGFREILDDEENFRVFLPGGIVGEHALFTIFENTIRNIKHYKDPDTLNNIQENGIDFWISIEEDKLVNTNPDKKQLFKVGVWLGHETNFITNEETKNYGGKTMPAEYLLFTITENTLKPILDESTGAPRMGGNSQDKACAAMLFNNKFSSVEENGYNEKGKVRNMEYFPWIEYQTFKVGVKKESDIKLEWKAGRKVINVESVKNYAKKINKDAKGYLKKYFYLWQGEDVFVVSKESDFDAENISRFRFVVINNENEKVKLETRAREEGVIRIMYEKLNIRTLYNHWLREFLHLNKIESNKKYLKYTLQLKAANGNASKFGDIIIGKNSSYFIGATSFSDNSITKGKCATLINLNSMAIVNDANKIKFMHGSTLINDGSYCNVRSHGWFLSRLFEGSNGKESTAANFPKGKITNIPNSRLDLFEFIEAALCKVIVFDNRVFERFPKDEYNKPLIHYEEQLNLLIFKENKNDLDVCFKTYKNLENNDVKPINFLVIHLSFIESLEYRGERINDFIAKYIEPLLANNPNLILVITTGRGRDEWWEKLKPVFRKFTLFKPIESILSAIESGLSYKDDIDIKFNLIKILFGS